MSLDVGHGVDGGPASRFADLRLGIVQENSGSSVGYAYTHIMSWIKCLLLFALVPQWAPCYSPATPNVVAAMARCGR